MPTFLFLKSVRQPDRPQAVTPLRSALFLCLALGVLATGCAKNIASPALNEPTVPLANQPGLVASSPNDQGSQSKSATIQASAKASHEQVAIAGSDLVIGRSRILVDAPIASVRRRVLRFKDYAKFMPHYEASVVLGKRPDGNKRVYMQVAALRGMVKMGAEIAMGVPMRDGDTEIYASEFIKGKRVKMFKAVWRLSPKGPKQTELWLDVFLHPTVPLPAGLINDQNIKGAAKGVAAMKRRSEGK